jgi:hypothetical protein
MRNSAIVKGGGPQLRFDPLVGVGYKLLECSLNPPEGDWLESIVACVYDWLESIVACVYDWLESIVACVYVRVYSE